MNVVAVNVGLPREVVWKGMTVHTAIFKQAVAGPVAIGKLNLSGDEQADLSVHGGTGKAVYAYPAEHYGYWREQLPGMALLWGAFGENLTTEGLSEDRLCIGDILQVGSALLLVTQPRLPCYKLQIRFDRDDMAKRFLKSGRTGFYFSVVQSGITGAGAQIEIVRRDPNHVSVADILRLYLGHTRDVELLERAMAVSALPQNWRAELLRRLQMGTPESEPKS